ncbi:MAG: T9SS type A sorting domain-containing protein [Bacteroidota bacterium]
MRKGILTTVLMLIMFSAGIQVSKAQRGPGYGPGPHGPGSPPPEVIRYFEKNMLPVLKIQHEELAQSISKADKEKLIEIRAELKELRDQHRARRAELRENQSKPSLDERREMRAMRNEMHDLMDEVAVMAGNYHNAIEAALQPVEDKIPEWGEDLKEICRAKGNCRRGNMERLGRGRRANFAGGPGHRSMVHRITTPEGFLLFDPSEPLPFLSEDFPTRDELNINLFPNPASGSVQVSIELEEETSVEITLMDGDGISTGFQVERKAQQGLFNETLNLKNLDRGVYFVKIEAGGKSSIKQLIVQK